MTYIQVGGGAGEEAVGRKMIVHGYVVHSFTVHIHPPPPPPHTHTQIPGIYKSPCHALDHITTYEDSRLG